ncbi:hypothetical protein Aam_092_047 [Acidocella aminolytica 101 = DSM 11237]|jgi:hypothetical protein|uniref:Uncharacterized protein n=1 Tax=Acidocella aminolytica 101 = DSM 11237 TaxID=1120923 RepID=A0A0D6PJ57_9PROT|nr:hypothetical protein [Acidocella aminolytica]GAN81426.1 hypothetical protein Aam_092_047 [Acidocella aminolytica 101 = DSM 11237]GBQ40931.1 hypothetical protein AA11237_2543 [Acidocella aminolytica 101 = DSM 11237]
MAIRQYYEKNDANPAVCLRFLLTARCEKLNSESSVQYAIRIAAKLEVLLVKMPAREIEKDGLPP